MHAQNDRRWRFPLRIKDNPYEKPVGIASLTQDAILKTFYSPAKFPLARRWAN
jgi:hypothetical protein